MEFVTSRSHKNWNEKFNIVASHWNGQRKFQNTEGVNCGACKWPKISQKELYVTGKTKQDRQNRKEKEHAQPCKIMQTVSNVLQKKFMKFNQTGHFFVPCYLKIAADGDDTMLLGSVKLKQSKVALLAQDEPPWHTTKNSHSKFTLVQINQEFQRPQIKHCRTSLNFYQVLVTKFKL